MAIRAHRITMGVASRECVFFWNCNDILADVSRRLNVFYQVHFSEREIEDFGMSVAGRLWCIITLPNSESNARGKLVLMSEKKVLAVDFDGVIAEYDGWTDGTPGVPRQDVLLALAELKSEGWKIIVHSCRPTNILIAYLEDNGVPFDEVNPGSPYADDRGKPSATVYWDDRAYKYSGDARSDIDAIRNFKTWSGRS